MPRPFRFRLLRRRRDHDNHTPAAAPPPAPAGSATDTPVRSLGAPAAVGERGPASGWQAAEEWFGDTGALAVPAQMRLLGASDPVGGELEQPTQEFPAIGVDPWKGAMKAWVAPEPAGFDETADGQPPSKPAGPTGWEALEGWFGPASRSRAPAALDRDRLREQPQELALVVAPAPDPWGAALGRHFASAPSSAAEALPVRVPAPSVRLPVHARPAPEEGQGRADAEAARQEAERGRVAAEQARGVAEEGRQDDERLRTAREAQRVRDDQGRRDAEALRAQAHQDALRAIATACELADQARSRNEEASAADLGRLSALRASTLDALNGLEALLQGRVGEVEQDLRERIGGLLAEINRVRDLHQDEHDRRGREAAAAQERLRGALAVVEQSRSSLTAVEAELRADHAQLRAERERFATDQRAFDERNKVADVARQAQSDALAAAEEALHRAREAQEQAAVNAEDASRRAQQLADQVTTLDEAIGSALALREESEAWRDAQSHLRAQAQGILTSCEEGLSAIQQGLQAADALVAKIEPIAAQVESQAADAGRLIEVLTSRGESVMSSADAVTTAAQRASVATAGIEADRLRAHDAAEAAAADAADAAAACARAQVLADEGRELTTSLRAQHERGDQERRDALERADQTCRAAEAERVQLSERIARTTTEAAGGLEEILVGRERMLIAGEEITQLAGDARGDATAAARSAEVAREAAQGAEGALESATAMLDGVREQAGRLEAAGGSALEAAANAHGAARGAGAAAEAAAEALGDLERLASASEAAGRRISAAEEALAGERALAMTELREIQASTTGQAAELRALAERAEFAAAHAEATRGDLGAESVSQDEIRALAERAEHAAAEAAEAADALTGRASLADQAEDEARTRFEALELSSEENQASLGELREELRVLASRIEGSQHADGGRLTEALEEVRRMRESVAEERADLQREWDLLGREQGELATRSAQVRAQLESARSLLAALESTRERHDAPEPAAASDPDAVAGAPSGRELLRSLRPRIDVALRQAPVSDPSALSALRGVLSELMDCTDPALLEAHRTRAQELLTALGA